MVGQELVIAACRYQLLEEGSIGFAKFSHARVHLSVPQSVLLSWCGLLGACGDLQLYLYCGPTSHAGYLI